MSNLRTPFLFFIISALACSVFTYFYLDERETYSWQPLKVAIDSVYIDKIGSGFSSVYTNYSYTINDTVYFGGGPSLDDYGDEIIFKNTEMDKYWEVKSRDSLQIYYNPDSPKESVTYPSANVGFLWGLVITGLFALLGLAGVITALTGK